MRGFISGLFLAIGLAGTTAHAQTVTGNYAVGGTNFDGSPYAGTAEVIPTGSTCRIVWHTGATASEGICMLSNKAFAAFYKLGPDYGLVVYELQPDGSLKGHWSVSGKQGVGTETLVPQR